MPCSGCGGKSHTPGPSHGHILGCGWTQSSGVRRYNPFSGTEQEEILFDSVNLALKSAAKPGTKGFATALADALAKELGDRCKE